jgi:hypothetical protein
VMATTIGLSFLRVTDDRMTVSRELMAGRQSLQRDVSALPWDPDVC